MPELTQAQLVGIAVSCAVVILAVGLTVTLVLAKKRAVQPAAPSSVVPPPNPDAPLRPVQPLTCAPTAATLKQFQLQPCDTQQQCTGCKEYTGPESVYNCVAVTGTNNMVDAAGNLVHPLTVSFAQPADPAQPCSGQGKVVDGKCVCNPGLSGEQCNLISQTITTPGTYCLPQTAQLCNTPTSQSVAFNSATGKGAEYACECKQEYAGMFAQAVEGGVCDQPLVCGNDTVQLERDMTPKLYDVFTHKNADGEPQFERREVYTNRLTAAPGAGKAQRLKAFEDCFVKVDPPKQVSAPGSKPYMEAHVSSSADPTCQPSVFSNLCIATANITKQLKSDVVLRGSGRPGDPLKTRVYPPFYRPVPPGLQRCPDGYAGSNTLNDRCRKQVGGNVEYLMFRPCQPSAKDSSVLECTDAVEAVFDSEGEWNGYFTNMKELKLGRVVLPDKQEVAATDIQWNTVSTNAVPDVSCDNNDVWLTRTTEEAVARGNCATASCSSAFGLRAKQWDGTLFGDLFNAERVPWFAAGPYTIGSPSPDYGGQCDCRGVTYMASPSTGRLDDVALAPGYLANNSNSDTWWQCVRDTCQTGATPHGRLDPDASLTAPACLCTDGSGSSVAPFKTYMSYKPEGQSPTCVQDPCNPDGHKTTTQIGCFSNDDCGGVCHRDNHKCFFNSRTPCTDDSECVALGARVKGVCDVKGTKTCLFQDPERANSHCDTDSDCSYGVCTNLSVKNLVRQGGVETFTMGTCSGGCVCDIEAVQRTDATNPLGFVCKQRCATTPCVASNTRNCQVDRATGEQVCDCRACFSGDKCQTGSLSTTIDKYTFPLLTTGEYRLGENHRLNPNARRFKGVIDVVHDDGSVDVTATGSCDCSVNDTNCKAYENTSCKRALSAAEQAENSVTRLPALQVIAKNQKPLEKGDTVIFYPHDVGVVEPGDYGARCGNA